MSPIEDPIKYANVQLLVLANDLRNTQLESIHDLEQAIGKLQLCMHMLFQLKQQLEGSDTSV